MPAHIGRRMWRKRGQIQPLLLLDRLHQPAPTPDGKRPTADVPQTVQTARSSELPRRLSMRVGEASDKSRTTAKAATSAGVSLGLVSMVVTDIAVPGVRAWWGSHAAVTSVASSLLVVAASVLIVDGVIGRRRRKERAVSVAVQAAIVYDPTQRAYDALTTPPAAPIAPVSMKSGRWRGCF
jgi:hypothetical protein